METMEVWVILFACLLHDKHIEMIKSVTVRQIESTVFTYALIRVENNEINQAKARACHVPFNHNRVKVDGVPDHIICASCALEMIQNSASGEKP